VNATLTLGTLQIFTKVNVGGALLTIEESGTGECGAVGIQFGAGSWPERLKGFNRFGMTQELVRVENCAVAESTYMSFMTSSREANLSQAQHAFRTAAHDLPLTIARGRVTPDGMAAKILHKTVAANFSWIDCPKLMQELRAQIVPVSDRMVGKHSGPVLPTFLYAVRRSLLQSSGTTTLYAHNATVYWLKTEARRDHRSGELIVTARTKRPGDRAESEFKLWLDSGTERDLPLRIEFHPKSYLKLTLEADKAQIGPAFKPLFQKAQL
jgi:hypothetical protein